MGSRDYLGEFEHVVLLALRRLGPLANGASIHREIAERTGRDAAIAAVYVTLKRLQKKGLVRSSVARDSNSGRKTRDYEILPPGHAALARSRELLENLWEGSDPEPA